MISYSEETKQQARDEALKFAIKTLTINRHKSTIARKSYVKEVKEYFEMFGTTHDKRISSKLSDAEICRWESFYQAIIHKKKPSELRVAYLSGPNPENDIKVLVKYGVLPENIWAFESDNKMYSTAVVSALNSEFPFVKIYKGKIETYLKLFPFKFDIIYLDFCKTLASENTLSVVRDVFTYQKLETLGVLITNFALPNKKTKENIEYRENLNLLAANYLYPKSCTEKLSGLGGGFVESAEAHGIDTTEFQKIAKRNERTFYSQLITRTLYDMPSLLLPYQKLVRDKQLSELFFKKIDNSFKKDDYDEDLSCFPTENSLVWGLSDFFIAKESFPVFLTKFKKQLSLNSDPNSLTDQIKAARYYIMESHEDGIHSEKLEKIRKNWKAFEKYIFCDVFLFHQLKEILIGQLVSPYYYNVDYTRRWVYTAKQTEMYMDLITYDQCRYIFDWMPTLDMFEEGVGDWNRQLSLRFAMDSIAKQSRWYNDEFFYGTAVIDQNKAGFEAKELKKRKLII